MREHKKHCKTAENIQQLKSTFELVTKGSKKWKSPTHEGREREGGGSGKREGYDCLSFWAPSRPISKVSCLLLNSFTSIVGFLSFRTLSGPLTKVNCLLFDCFVR